VILRPLANAASSLAKRPEIQSNSELPNRRYAPVGALVILAVAIGVVLVLVVEWFTGLIS
jgi:hypothetical protein